MMPADFNQPGRSRVSARAVLLGLLAGVSIGLRSMVVAGAPIPPKEGTP